MVEGSREAPAQIDSPAQGFVRPSAKEHHSVDAGLVRARRPPFQSHTPSVGCFHPATYIAGDMVLLDSAASPCYWLRAAQIYIDLLVNFERKRPPSLHPGMKHACVSMFRWSTKNHDLRPISMLCENMHAVPIGLHVRLRLSRPYTPGIA